MVGVFSKLSASRSARRRNRTALEERAEMPPTADASDVANIAASSEMSHGINMSIEFTPVDHPTEPLDSDQPVICPLPEPSILNDGRLWKERVSAASMRGRTDLSLTNEGTADSDVIVRTTSAHCLPSNSIISHSQSAPEHNLLNLLEECNTSEN